MIRNQNDKADSLQNVRAAFVGKLASMSRKDATALLREAGAVVVDRFDAETNLLVIGEYDLPFPKLDSDDDWFTEDVRLAAEEGRVEIVTETKLWRRLKLVDEHEHDSRRLYTPAMLADLLGVSTSTVRRWNRRGLIKPVREVRKLPYFDYQEAVTAQRLAGWLASGISPQVLEKKLADLAKFLPDVDRPLAQLSIIVEGKHVLLRQENGLIDSAGQKRFEFQAPEAEETANMPTKSLASLERALPTTPEELCAMAAEAEEEGRLAESADLLRAALAAGGPNAEICFQLAEILYRSGDLSGACERYYMAVELNEEYVEARANLGCVLVETGRLELAVAAFEGALKYHPDYADAHYQLAKALDDLGRGDEALSHWKRFLELAPENPWADEVRRRLNDVAN